MWTYVTLNSQTLLLANFVACEIVNATHNFKKPLEVSLQQFFAIGFRDFTTKSSKLATILDIRCALELRNLLILCVHHTPLKTSQIMCPMVALIPWLENHKTLPSWKLIEVNLE